VNERIKLLIGYDGSESADAAVEDIQRAGLPRDTEAIVFAVADVWFYPPPADPTRPAPPSPLDQQILSPAEEMRARATQALIDSDDVARQGAARLRALFPSWEINVETTINWPSWGIITKAEEWGADLVVVGSGKHSIIERLKLGSTSAKVLSACRCSVRVGRRLTTSANSSVRIVIGVDGSSDAELAVDAVARRVWPAGSEARLITVLDTRLAHAVVSLIPRLARWSGGGELDQKDDAWLQRMVTAATQKLQSAGLAVSTTTPEGDPREILVEAASSWKADCIFLGARGLSGIERFLIGSVSSSVATAAGCSVEVVRSVGARESRTSGYYP
jgi:nucleotide-binding universal stress UspA family protein